VVIILNIIIKIKNLSVKSATDIFLYSL